MEAGSAEMAKKKGSSKEGKQDNKKQLPAANKPATKKKRSKGRQSKAAKHSPAAKPKPAIWSPHASRVPGKVPELVNTEEGIINMLAACQKVKQIAIDLEGISLSRHGKVCLLALATSATSVWVIDTITLGQAAFEAASKGQQSLKALLESPEVQKLMFDPRRDSDALYHQFGIHLQNVMDLQLSEVAYRREKGQKVVYVSGLAKCLAEYLSDKVVCSPFTVDKDAVHKRLDEDKELFAHRPLDDDLLRYCAQDVCHLFELHARLITGVSYAKIEKVREASAQRVAECLMPSLPEGGKHRALAPDL